ncbi:MAG TPA: hypothetical protein VIL97_10625 [Thermoanaerobaculia bacterium]
MRPLSALLLLVTLLALPLVAEDRAVCAVCGPREGSGFEPVKATATYRGKQYFFCSPGTVRSRESPMSGKSHLLTVSRAA